MKPVSLLILSALFFLPGCKKSTVDRCEAALLFTKVTVSPQSSVVNGIMYNTEAYGPNLCYSYKELRAVRTGPTTFEINAIAEVPCKAPVCAQALYQARPSGTISSLPAGTYTLTFYNYDAVFTSISVTIN